MADRIYFIKQNEHLFRTREENGILTKEEKEFVQCFARTFSVKEAARAAGFDSRTAFARASRLLEREEVRDGIKKLAAGSAGDGIESPGSTGLSPQEERILQEYEKIAFADTADGEIKVADKLRALDQYRALCDRMKGDGGGDLSLVVNYDYGE